MALITRVSRLFRADLHAVLDRIEEPELLLKQAIRDMDEDLASDRQRQRLLHHERSQLANRLTDTAQSLERIETELDICFESAKEDLARTLVKRKLEAQRLHNRLAQKSASLGQELAALQVRIADHQSHLDSLRDKAELLVEEQSTSEYEPDRGVADISVRDEDIEIAFLREQQKRRPT